MPKIKEKSSEEWYRGRIRELEKENRSLQKRIRQLEKSEHMFEDALLSNEEIIIEEKPKKKTCPDCGKGSIKEFTLLDRVFEECDTCGYRRKVK